MVYHRQRGRDLFSLNNMFVLSRIRPAARLGKAFSAALLCLAILVFLPTAIQAQPINVGYTSRTIFFLPFFVSQKKGFYDTEGIHVNIVYTGSPAVNLQALVAGQIQVSATNPDSIIIFDEKGGDLKAIAGVVNGVAYNLIGRKTFRKIDDLKGSKIGVASLVGGPTTFLLEYLRAKGLIYPRDFTLIQIPGGTPARLAAIESGAVAAGLLDITNSEIAVDRGFIRLGDVSEVVPKFQFTTINVNPGWAAKNRTVLTKFLKAHINSMRWIYEHPTDATDFYSEEMGAKQPYAQRGLEYFIKHKLFPIDGAIDLDGMKANIDIQEKLGLIKKPTPDPESYIDPTYLKAAQKELGM